MKNRNYKTLDDILAEMTPDRRAYVEKRGQELIDEYATLQELRKAQKMTQEQIGRFLGINQENISRLEKRSDLMISTLKSYIEAMGGKLQISVEFPGKRRILLQGFGLDAELDESVPSAQQATG